MKLKDVGDPQGVAVRLAQIPGVVSLEQLFPRSPNKKKRVSWYFGNVEATMAVEALGSIIADHDVESAYIKPPDEPATG